jgi:hypothetical protein
MNFDSKCAVAAAQKIETALCLLAADGLTNFALLAYEYAYERARGVESNERADVALFLLRTTDTQENKFSVDIIHNPQCTQLCCSRFKMHFNRCII